MVYVALAALVDLALPLVDAGDAGPLLLQPAASAARAPTTVQSTARRIGVLIFCLSSTAV
jgi:hypothetical protein